MTWQRSLETSELDVVSCSDGSLTLGMSVLGSTVHGVLTVNA